MLATPEQRQWLSRVLHIDVPANLDRHPSPSSGDFVQLQKCRLVWDVTRKNAIREIAQFIQIVEQDFEGDEEENAVLEALEQLDKIEIALDDRLLDELDALLNMPADAPERSQQLAAVRRVLGEYEKFAAADPIFQALSGPTPFGVSLSVASMVRASLTNLRAVLH